MFSVNDLKKTGKNIKFGKTDYDVYNLDEFEALRLKHNTKKNNGNIVAGCILVNYQDILTKGRPMQTRVRDTEDSKIIELTSQIKEGGLLNIPTVKWDKKKGEFVLLGGHHRLTVLWNIYDETEEDPDVPCVVPVCVLDFPTKDDQHNFCNADNNHPTSLDHTREDAKKMLQDKEDMGAFKRLDDKKKEAKAIKYLMSGYTALAPTIRKAQNLYKKLQAAPTVVSYIKPPVPEIKQAQKAAWGHSSNQKHAAALQDDGSVALHGNSQMYQNTLGNFRKNFWRQFGNCPAQKFEMKLATHVQITKNTSPDHIRKSRETILQDLANENNMMYLPVGRGHVEEVLIMAQIKDGIEQDAIHVWDKDKFVFSRNI